MASLDEVHRRRITGGGCNGRGNQRYVRRRPGVMTGPQGQYFDGEELGPAPGRGCRSDGTAECALRCRSGARIPASARPKSPSASATLLAPCDSRMGRRARSLDNDAIDAALRSTRVPPASSTTCIGWKTGGAIAVVALVALVAIDACGLESSTEYRPRPRHVACDFSAASRCRSSVRRRWNCSIAGTFLPRSSAQRQRQLRESSRR